MPVPEARSLTLQLFNRASWLLRPLRTQQPKTSGERTNRVQYHATGKSAVAAPSAR